ncbi:terminase large subunit domain-containing protein, partial [Mycolicibacter algericus]|uniref:terminase large subunit domain-containing protein n=1 Tax=Mycolicibacter algericus TaxID=1288388 RepID=UPI0019634B2C
MTAGTKKLSEVARHVVKPSKIASTGWPAVEKTCRDKLGIEFDEWQRGAGRLILAKRKDGTLAATVGGVGMSLPRQVGKTYLLAGMVFGLCVDNPGLLFIWSAHHARTHGETFLAMQAFASKTKVAPFIEQVFKGSGDEEIRFVNGSRILFGARERGFGRGIPGVDGLIADEAQILSDKAQENMLATMNTSSFGLHVYVGTPPKPEDASEAFTRMRTEALSGTSDDLAWIECGADPDADPDDRSQYPVMNPSHPHRTPLVSILRLRKKLCGLPARSDGDLAGHRRRPDRRYRVVGAGRPGVEPSRSSVVR